MTWPLVPNNDVPIYVRVCTHPVTTIARVGWSPMVVKWECNDCGELLDGLEPERSESVVWDEIEMDRDACEHPGLFSGSVPSEVTGDVMYQAWLDSTKHCGHCNRHIPIRDL